MSGWLLESGAILDNARTRRSAPSEHEIELSKAISAKRQADALERLAKAAEASAEAMNVNGEWSITAALNRIAQGIRK